MLSFSSLQMLPLATAQVATQEPNAAAKVPQGFKLMGTAPDALPVLASIAIPIRNLDLLTSYVQQVSNPSSPMFGHFFTEQQIAQDFLPTAQYGSMMQYLASTPLSVQFTALDSMILVQGTVGQLKEYLGTGINVYSNGTASYYMASSPTFRGALLYASNSTSLFAKPAVSPLQSTPANVTFTSGGFPANLLQSVYNATSLYSRGFNGTGKTIGIMDWFGSPTVASDLKAFDKQFGFADPKFQIIPVGPYDPNLGAYTGWNVEISLDVEVSHAMAPGANVDLYIANNALTVADAIAAVVQDNKVNTLSQSWTLPEWIFSFLPPAAFEFNVLLPDIFYQLGTLRGITFTGSTGDTGGSGYTSGVEGELGYPASSPYVTAVGG
ncbi:MAG TPA: protease pro-enzyme activation domain-containing protein, partial [Nitrososphaerales archaeon]|nr:protease pro-enzyme activation domain-containing protein [Nitrososphaerales archaeon]